MASAHDQWMRAYDRLSSVTDPKLHDDLKEELDRASDILSLGNVQQALEIVRYVNQKTAHYVS